MLDTFLLTTITLFKEPFIAIMLIAASTIVFMILTLKQFPGILKTAFFAGYIALLSSIINTASTEMSPKDISYMSKLECSSINFDAHKKFQEFYNESDNVLNKIEAKIVFIEYDNCQQEIEEIGVSLLQNLKDYEAILSKQDK